jgi:hypothetical protein
MSIPADKGPAFSGKDWLHNIPLTGGAGYNIDRPQQRMAVAKTAALPPELHARAVEMAATLKKALRESNKERIKVHAQAQRLGKTAHLGGLASQASSGSAPLTGGACYGAQSQPRDIPKKPTTPPVPAIKQAYDLGCTFALRELLKVSAPILPKPKSGYVHNVAPQNYKRGLNPQGQHFDPTASVGSASG